MPQSLRFGILALVVFAGVAGWLFLRQIGQPVPWWATVPFNVVCLWLLLWALERPGRSNNAGQGTP
jgi:hypothetical protein